MVIMNLTNNAIETLVQSWYSVANNNITSTDARIQLYEETKKVIDSLNDLLTNPNITVQERVAGLGEKLLSAFNDHQLNEFISLADWVAEHSPTEKEGAYAVLHRLFNTILKASKVDPESEKAQPLNFIAAVSLFQLNRDKKNYPLELSNIEPALLVQNKSLQEMLKLRNISKQNKEFVDSELINLLNNRKRITSELRLYTPQQIISFFGENCSKIETLSFDLRHLTGISNLKIKESKKETKTGYFSNVVKTINELASWISTDSNQPESESDLPEQSDELSKNFTGLLSLHLFSQAVPDNVKETTILHFNNLNLPTLKALHFDNMDFQNIDLEFLKNLPLLEKLEIRQIGSVINLHILPKCCPHLRSLCIEGKSQKIESLNFLQDCLLLSELTLGNFNELADWSFLKEIKSLEKIDIKISPFLSDLDLQKLKKNNLTQVVIYNCPNVTDFSFVNEYLKDFCLYYSKVTDFSFLKNCPNLENLIINECTGIETLSSVPLQNLKRVEINLISTIDISFLKKCKNLERLTLRNCTITDFSFINDLPNIKFVNLKNNPGLIDEEQIKALQKKGVIVYY